jgi:hypothetical protein
MSTRKLSALIGNTSGLSALNRTLQHITALQRLYEVCAPPEMVSMSRVVGDRNGTWIIAADNGAVAAKLRQLAPRLLVKLQKQTAQVTGIQIQVQVSQPVRRPPPRPKTQSLSIDSIEYFDKLSQRIKDPGLRQALTRFVARRRAKD